MSYISDIWLYPLHDWWRTVNEMLDFMYTGQTGNFIFRPVIGTKVGEGCSFTSGESFMRLHDIT